MDSAAKRFGQPRLAPMQRLCCSRGGRNAKNHSSCLHRQLSPPLASLAPLGKAESRQRQICRGYHGGNRGRTAEGPQRGEGRRERGTCRRHMAGRGEGTSIRRSRRAGIVAGCPGRPRIAAEGLRGPPARGVCRGAREPSWGTGIPPGRLAVSRCPSRIAVGSSGLTIETGSPCIGLTTSGTGAG